jgi:NAD(P)-dependent dehydrogenase (short-subunit alcohol dehydrogenase family)
VLVNNAGILADPRGSRVLDSKPETYRETLATNVLGPLMLAQALVPLMRSTATGASSTYPSAMGQLSDMGTGSPRTASRRRR